MPLTFIEIEKQKNWRIGIFFVVLLFIYFFITITLAGAVFLVSPLPFITSGAISSGHILQYIIVPAGFALLIASIHFWFSTYDAVNSVMHKLGASAPDPEDGIHKRLINIMEEIHVVTGNKKRIGCMVIPSLSMNAIAVADLRGNAAVLITEGLLSRLTRPQLEAVLAHEIHHIFSGDCLEATVAASLFGVYAAAMEKLQDTSDRRATFFPAFVLACILLKLSQILNMFISREREYRADAASVRMTRNPLALAEALHLLSRNWRGMGFIGNGLEMLCIVNPQAKELDESEGFWADLMSTHPPIKKRIEILLRMAHASMAELDRKPKMPDTVKATEPFYYAIDPKQQWQGPYALSELASLPWFSPLTWISSAAGVGRAWENPLFETIFSDRLSRSEDEVTDLSCPSCKQPLIERSYENTQIFQCKFCSGILVENDRIPRIIARKETPCTDRVKSLAKAVISQNRINLTKQISKAGDRKNIPHTVCPKCKDPMTRLFYSLAYLIEIDRCSMCSMTWFDAEELEMLRCLIENKITAVDIPQ